MKKLLSTLCISALFSGVVADLQAENPDDAPLAEVIPGECFLDGLFSSPQIYIDDMDGVEVPLVASWRPADIKTKNRYAGDARFGVFNFTIGEGRLIDSYTVDISLIMDDPHIAKARKDNLLLYSCEDGSERCTATLVAVKAAITEQIARENRTQIDEIKYQSDARATLLGVFVKGTQPPPTEIRGEKKPPYRLTEVCGMYELTLTEGHAISSLIKQSVKPN